MQLGVEYIKTFKFAVQASTLTSCCESGLFTYNCCFHKDVLVRPVGYGAHVQQKQNNQDDATPTNLAA